MQHNGSFSTHAELERQTQPRTFGLLCLNLVKYSSAQQVLSFSHVIQTSLSVVYDIFK